MPAPSTMTKRSQLVLLILLAVSTAFATAWLRGEWGQGAGHADESRAGQPQATSGLPASLSEDESFQVERARAATTPPQPALADDVPAASSGLSTSLRVLVVRADDRRPIVDCEVRLAESIDSRRPPEYEFFTCERRTNAEGFAEFDPALDRELYLNAGQFSDESARAASEPEVGFAHDRVSPFHRGEQRVLTIALPVGEDLSFWGRAVTDADRMPIQGARIRLRDRLRSQDWRGLVAGPDSTGLFRIQCPSWRPVEFSLEADDFASVLGRVGAGHETREHALDISMKRAARLDVRVLESGGAPATEVTVQLTTDAFEVRPDDEGSWAWSSGSVEEDPVWSVHCDPNGACSVTGLPPRVPLTVSIIRSGKPDWRLPERIDLLPGEIRAVAWDIGAGARLSVRVLDQSGAPVSHRVVWLTRRALGVPQQPGRCYFYKGEEEDVTATRETNNDGRCEFDAVTEGTW
jgi:hypothetical protein